MKKKYKVLLVIIMLVLIALIGIYVYFQFFRVVTESEPPMNEVIVTNTIDNYGYNLEDRDTELFKEKFEKLKNLLNTEDFEEEDYVKLVSELFIIDLFTIDNKISRYDIGGVEYMYSTAVESFKSVIDSSIYKAVENNLDNSRTQQLPVVSTIEVTDVSETTYTMPDDSVINGYKVNLSWTYEVNLGYDSKAVLIVVPDGEKMGVIFYKAKS